MTEQKRGRGRPRRAGADDEILAVAFDMLHKHGLRDLSVDAIAERTGMAKTTIYRRWPSKAALAAAAIESRTPLPESGSPATLLEHFASILTIVGTPDPDAFEVLAVVIAPHRDLLRDALGASADAPLRADMLLGAMLTRFLAGEEITAELLRGLTHDAS